MLGNISFAAPILPGKTDAWKAAAAKINGARKSEYEASRHRLGVKSERAFLQPTPMGDLIIVSIEADETDSVMEQMGASATPLTYGSKRLWSKAYTGWTSAVLPQCPS